MFRPFIWAVPVFLLCAILLPVSSAHATDPYTTYILTSPDFQSVKQDKAWEYAAFPSWTYMPWPYQWNSGYSTASGQWAVAHGYNGFTILGQDTTPLAMINANGMGFYVDHAGGKGDLHIWDGATSAQLHLVEGDGHARGQGWRHPRPRQRGHGFAH